MTTPSFGSPELWCFIPAGMWKEQPGPTRVSSPLSDFWMYAPLMTRSQISFGCECMGCTVPGANFVNAR